MRQEHRTFRPRRLSSVTDQHSDDLKTAHHKIPEKSYSSNLLRLNVKLNTTVLMFLLCGTAAACLDDSRRNIANTFPWFMLRVYELLCSSLLRPLEGHCCVCVWLQGAHIGMLGSHPLRQSTMATGMEPVGVEMEPIDNEQQMLQLRGRRLRRWSV